MTRRRRRWPAVLLALLLVVGVLAVAGDGLARRTAEHRAAASVQRRLGTRDLPAVSFGGGLFLPQALRHRFSSVRVQAHGVSSAGGGTAVTVQEVDLTLHDVRASPTFQRLTAGSADGTARLDYATAGRLAGVPVRYGGRPGTLAASVSQQVLGTDMLADVRAVVAIDVGQQSLLLRDPQVTVAGTRLPDDVARSLVGQLVKPVPVGSLPLGLRLSGVTTGPDGIDARLTGQQLQLTG